MEIAMKPEVEQFIRQQVNSGRFTSTAEVLEAGIARLMLEPEPTKLDEDEKEEVRLSLEEMRQGKVLDWREYSAKLRQSHRE